MLTLYQAEWCPHSSRVRQTLTELGLDFVARQVPADPQERDEMRADVGTNEIPVLVPDGGKPIAGERDILRYLRDEYEPRPDAKRHREKWIEEADERDPRH